MKITAKWFVENGGKYEHELKKAVGKVQKVRDWYEKVSFEARRGEAMDTEEGRVGNGGEAAVDEEERDEK